MHGRPGNACWIRMRDVPYRLAMHEPDVFSFRFLGVGSAQAADLGSSCGVLERAGVPLLLIDIGVGALDRYAHVYSDPPAAVFITHTHLDHIGDLEHWFYRLAFRANPGLPKLFVPAAIVPLLQRRVADFPNWVAEGGRNFWDMFQLIPVSDYFWHAGLRFAVFPVRHHAPESAFGLALRGSFLYTGDTRPVPEWLQKHAHEEERIFHDCSAESNPSHTGLDDLEREYGAAVRSRLVLYHYADEEAAAAMRVLGYEVAKSGAVYPLSHPNEESTVEHWAAWSQS
ncbi:MAG: MBL fold metallo-hydrolase [Lysobacterales bacterium]